MFHPTLGPGAAARPAFSFVDLFAGIGGLRLAFAQAGGACVFTSEWNRFARETYRANHDGWGHAIAGDIRAVPADAIPPHDVLLAGFPCQPFSLAGIGVRNQRGTGHGFADRTQGTLFFEIARIIAHHRPRAFLLENVKNLLHHDSGRTFAVIRATLAEELGYHVQWRVLNGQGLTPQRRRRAFIVGFRDQCDFDFEAFEIAYPRRSPKLGDILEPDDVIGDAFTISDRALAYVETRAATHAARGNGFRAQILGPNDILPAITTRNTTTEALFIDQAGRNPRRLTPRECARAMGFPDSFAIPVSKTQAYRQFGNSVVVPLVAQIARVMRPYIVEPAATQTAQYAPHFSPDRDFIPALDDGGMGVRCGAGV